MPELPEVETIVRSFRKRLTGRRIVAFESRWERQVSPDVSTLRRMVVGQSIARLGRRGKYIVFQLSDSGWMLVHLKMSGRLEWERPDQPEPPHVRAAWKLDGRDRLLFCDARKFGRIVYVPDLADISGRLGLEPLARTFSITRLAEVLGRRARRLKPLLLDQSIVAGLGNIYADEALFRAGLHPLARSDRLTPAQVARLHRAIRDALTAGIRHNGATIDWVYPSGNMQDHFRVYGRTGKPCRRCCTPIEYLRVAQRGTHICPRCQPPV